MNVCLLNDSFPPLIDGVSNAVMNYGTNLVKHGNNVLVVTPYYPDTVDDYPYEVMRYQSLDTTKLVGYRAGLPFDQEAVKRVTNFSPDIYHSHCPVSSTFMARILREHVKAPMVFTYHTKFDIDIANAVRGKLLQEAALSALVANVESSDEVWVVSEGAGQNLRSIGYTGEYRVMRNGVDIPRAKPDAELVSSVRAAHNIPESVPVFLFVGRMMWYKGLRTLLDALRGLKDAEIDFRMIFVGGGGDEAEVRAYSDKLLLNDKVIFTGSISDRNLLRAYFGVSDLFMFLSDFDTNGLVVREAAACGLGSMLLRGSAAAEEVVHKHNGFLSERTPEAVAAQLAYLTTDRQAMKKVGENAMNELYFSWEDSVRVAEDRYAQIIDDYKCGKLKIKTHIPEQIIEAVEDVRETMEKAHNFPKKVVSRVEEKIDQTIDEIESRFNDIR